MPTERDHDERLERTVRSAVKYALDSRFQLGKNGEGWKDYVGRLVTPERLGLAILLVYQLGGGVNEARQAIQAAAAQAVIASARADQASQKADIASQKADSAAAALLSSQQQIDTLVADMHQHAERDAELKESVSQRVTRSDFKQAIEQELKPRLDRIERQTWGAR